MWDYPRPPAVVPTSSLVEVIHAGHTVARTTAAIRVCETSQAPGFYLPPADVDTGVLRRSGSVTVCEWKGVATYWDLVVGGVATVADAAWSYDDPRPGYEAITGYLAFYPQRVDQCRVDGEVVAAGEGGFYGGWITSAVVGPFKGGAGTWGW